MVPTFFGITLVTFAFLHLAPGDPVSMSMGDAAIGQGAISREAIAHFRHTMGLDDPLPAQYAKWLWRIVRFDFGNGWRTGQPVTQLLAQSLPVTLLLSSIALFLSYAIAIPLGVHAAVKRDSPAEKLVTLLLFILYSLPVPFVAILIILLFGGGHFFNVLPIQGLHRDGFESLAWPARIGDLVWHLIAPVFCLTYGSLASLSRYMRGAMLDVIRQDYIRTARAKGLSERAVIFRHALRNSLLPLVTLLGLYLPFLVGGSVIVERIFGINGMGMLAFRAILERDYNVIMGVTTLTALLTMVGVLVSDLLYAIVDPRIRHA